MNVQLLGLFTIAAFYGLFFWVGSRGKQGAAAAGTSELLLAGRALPLWLGAMTMTATWVGGGYINGTAEAIADPERGLVWTQAPWGYALSLILGGLFFAGRMRRHGFTTLLDLFERRFGVRVTAGLFIAALLGEIFWSGAILAALGTTLSIVLGLNYSACVLISAAVAITYTARGGLGAVARTDALQLMCIFLGLGLALPFALQSVGGPEQLLQLYQTSFAESASFWPGANAFRESAGFWGWSWWDTALLLMLGGIPWQVYFQRVLACRDERTAVRLSVVAGLGCLVAAVPAGLLGAVGAVADWSGSGLGSEPGAALILPSVLRYLTPPLVAALGIGAVAAAVMSSVDSSILSASSMLVWNVYRPLFRPQATDAQQTRVLRYAIVAIGSAAAWLALSVGSVYTLWALCSDLVYVVLFPQLVCALFTRTANAWGSASGAVVGLLLRLGGGEPALGIAAFLPYPTLDTASATYFPFRTFAMLAGLATILLVSRLTARLDPPREIARA